MTAHAELQSEASHLLPSPDTCTRHNHFDAQHRQNTEGSTLAIVAFSLTQDEAGLFVVAAAYGLGFAGIIPAYSVAVRDVFPSSEASWRMPLTLFAGMSGMAVGSWLAGMLYDQFGTYAPAFMTGIIFNIANVLVIGFLVLRLPRARP